MEEYIPSKTENLHDYLIPSIGDVPEIESILIEKTIQKDLLVQEALVNMF